MRELKRLSIILTESCNKSCRFCFQKKNIGNKFIDLSKAKETLKDIKSVIKNNIKEGIEVTIIGGEPGLFKDYKKLYSLIIDVSEIYKINSIKLFSNLTIENSDMIVFLDNISKIINTNLVCTVNLSKDIRNRINENDQKTFDMNIDLIKKTKVRVSYNKVFDLKQINQEILKSLDNDTIKVDTYMFQPSTLNDIFTFDELKEIMKEILKYSLDNNKNFKDVAELIGLVYIDGSMVSKCQPFYSEVAIYGEGKILSCSLMLNHKDIFEGLTTVEILKKFSDRPSEKTETNINCINCPVRIHCHRCKITPIKSTLSNDEFLYSKELCNYERNKYSLFLEYYATYLKIEGGLRCLEDLN